MASPTICRLRTPSRSTVLHVSTGSTWVGSVGKVMVLPPVKALKAAHWAAPCISGATDIMATASLRDASTMSSIEANALGWPKGRPPMAPMKMSCWRHSTPLGMPVVPPV